MSATCECGCGEATLLHRQTDRGRGAVKGEPMRFVSGHQNRGRVRDSAPPVRSSTFEYGHRTLKAGDGGPPDLRAALDRQLRLLRSWEDPANDSSQAATYREMCAAATSRAIDGGALPARGWGEYGACGDPRKQRKAATA